MIKLKPGATPAGLGLRPGAIRYTYRKVFHGVAAQLSAADLAKLRRSATAERVEQDARAGGRHREEPVVGPGPDRPA